MDLQEPLIRRVVRLLKTDGASQLSRKKKSRSIWVWALVAVCFLGSAAWFQSRLYRLESKQKRVRQLVKELEFGVSSIQCLGKTPVPPRLASVPFAEDLGIVLAVKEVFIRDVVAPYNPTLIPSSSGYDLFFRYDLITSKLAFASYSSHIGVVPLNHLFEQEAKEFKRIDLQTEYADDPRVLFVGDQLYLFFNQLSKSNPECRFMCAANLDRTSYDVNYSTILDMNLKPVEKNWSPFEYIGEDQKPHLFLEYQIAPRKLLELPDPRINDLKNVTVPAEVAYLSLPWPEKWGKMSGGTPAQKIGSEYFGFFHSFFTDENGLAWYVMGAYTFEASPPFCLTGISKYPLLFHGIYESPFINTSSIEKRVIFPSGFSIERQGDRDLIHLACGENDCNIKIVTIDPENLKKSMIRLRVCR